MTASRAASALAVAAATCLLVLVAAWPSPLTANQKQPAAEIQMPTLDVEGLECTIQPIEEPESGKEATFRLRIRNTTTAEREIHLDLHLQHTPPASPMARMIPTPTTIWTDAVAVEIGPEETKTVELPVGKLPVGRLDMSMTCGDNTIIAWRRQGKQITMEEALSNFQGQMRNAREIQVSPESQNR